MFFVCSQDSVDTSNSVEVADFVHLSNVYVIIIVIIISVIIF